MIQSVVFFSLLIFTVGLIISSLLGKNEKKLFLTVFFIDYIVIFALYYLYQYQFGIPYMLAGSDALSYESDAYAVVNNLEWYEYFRIRGNLVPEAHNSVGYLYLVSLLIRIGNFIGEFHTLIPRIFNIFLLSFMSIISFRISKIKLLLNRRTSYIIALIIGLSPIMVYISSSTFRDILVSFIILLLVYLWSNFYHLPPFKKIFLSFMTAFLLFFLWELRNFASIIAVVLIIITVFKPLINYKYTFEKLQTNKKTKVVLLLLLLSIFAYFIFSGDIEWFFNRLFTYASRYTERRISGESEIAQFILTQNMPISILLRTAYFAIYPPPTLVASIDHIYIGIGTFFRILFYPFLFMGLWALFKNKHNLNIALAYLFIFITIAMTTLTFRHIVIFYPYEILIMGYGYNKYSGRIKDIEILWLVMFLFLIIFLTIYSIYSLS